MSMRPMRMREYDRMWGTAGWLDDHELAGGLSTAKLCQRKTKTHEYVRIATGSHREVNVGKVYRKRFDEGGDLCAAFLWGNANLKEDQRSTIRELAGVVRDFIAQPAVKDARVTTFLYDVPSGYWRAIVVFKKGDK